MKKITIITLFTLLVVLTIKLSLYGLTQSPTIPAQTATTTWEDSCYFDTNFLTDYNAVEQKLINKEGFREVCFSTQDNIKICGLLLERPHAKYNMIFCGGFYPGRKETLSTFFHMVPNNCNILFIDARGHGKSEGGFLTNIHQYGQHEYLDIVAAISFIDKNHYLPNPIVLINV